MNLSPVSLLYQRGLEGDVDKAFGKFKDHRVDMLEVGIFEGGSAELFFQKILTHPGSTYLGIDDNLRDIAKENFREYGSRATLVHGDSKRILPYIGNDLFDMIYIDGCHHVEYALSDLQHSLRMIRIAGVILVDDYMHSDYGLQAPIDNLLSSYEVMGWIQVLFRSYRIAIERFV